MSALEDELDFQLRALGLTGFERGYKFDPVRRWLADFAWLQERLIVEVDGGQFLPVAAHSSPRGRERDCVRDAEAVLAGWRVLRFPTAMIRDGRALAYIQRALKCPIIAT